MVLEKFLALHRIPERELVLCEMQIFHKNKKPFHKSL